MNDWCERLKLILTPKNQGFEKSLLVEDGAPVFTLRVLPTSLHIFSDTEQVKKGDARISINFALRQGSPTERTVGDVHVIAANGRGRPLTTV
jgi:hypothetical protein